MTEQRCSQRTANAAMNYNADAAAGSAVAGTVVEVSCKLGYQFADGSTKRMSQCLVNRQWNPPIDEPCQGTPTALFLKT